MYIEECDREDVRVDVVKSLKSFGLKYRLKNLDKNISMDEHLSDDHLFGIPLTYLRKEVVHLPQVKDTIGVPEFIVELCCYVEENVAVEGLFRKAGSAARQKEIKALLDKGEEIDLTSHHVIDIANILKLFLRELPEPVIPYKYHDTFLRCLMLKDRKEEAVILSCLLLPQDHLNTLAYLMMFFNKVSAHSELNKMGVSNLAIILAPNVMPVLVPKMTPEGTQVLNHHVQIVQILIRNADLIGVVPEHILSGELSFSSSSFQESFTQNKNVKKKKRRSGSLTRMLSGLKKMVSRGSPDHDGLCTPDMDKHTPCIMSGKKRKANENSTAPLSSGKKRDLLQTLPQGTVLSDTPYKSNHNNHKAENLTPRILVVTQKPVKSKSPAQKPKRRFFSKLNSDGVMSQTKSLSSSALKISRISLLGKSGRKKKAREESVGSINNSSLMATLDSHESPSSLHYDSFHETASSSEDYVRVPKSEYEAIKERVSKIETRLSHEIENIIGVSISDYESSPEKQMQANKLVSTADHIENAYKKTLHESEKFNSSSTEELAKRLSQGLKIRRSLENRVIRSPSARKIGSIRRRSRESLSVNKDLSSLNSVDRFGVLPFYPSKSLRRGKPNTVFSGLPHPSSLITTTINSHSTSLEPESEKEHFGVLTRSQTRRASSFHGHSHDRRQMNHNVLPDLVQTNDMHWKCAADFFDHDKESSENKNTVDIGDHRRASIAKLRCQNAGMVLAKAKLFNNMCDNTVSVEERISRPLSKSFRFASSKSRVSIRRKRSDHRILENLSRPLNTNKSESKGSNRNSPQGANGNLLLHENLKIGSQPMLKKTGSMKEKENFTNANQLPTRVQQLRGQIISPLKDLNRTPTIKRALTIGATPNHIRRTPNDGKMYSRNTPVKALTLGAMPRRSPRLFQKSKTPGGKY